ncbi:MAG: hypothetical protein KatS3mg026_0541 [Bacteroidia bacterium]|nr:MAG: hypothetical protein KatS3mg026_0541 [Bacteroidia bacterium]
MVAWLDVAFYGLSVAVGLGAVAAVVVWIYAFSLRKKLRDRLLSWENPAFGLPTAVLFMLALAFLSGVLLGYAFYLKYPSTSQVAVFWRSSTALFFLLFLETIVIYGGLQIQNMHCLAERGFYHIRFDWSLLKWRVELIPWEQVYDYYVHTEAVLSTFTLIFRDRRTISFQAPSYLRSSIEQVIDYGREKYVFLWRHGRSVTRSSSES